MAEEASVATGRLYAGFKYYTQIKNPTYKLNGVVYDTEELAQQAQRRFNLEQAFVNANIEENSYTYSVIEAMLADPHMFIEALK